MTILILIWTHFIADFVLQSHKMAIHKSKSFMWLALHAIVYSLCFIPWGLRFAFYMFMTHFIVDFVTSRGSARLWASGNMHWFFVLIGFDQAIHLTILIVLKEVL